jgi:hypothetical protein
MSTLKTIHEMTDADFEKIRRETLERDAVEPRASAARYDRKSERVIVELKNGVVFMVPVQLIQGLAGAAPKLLTQVEMDGRGYGLNWEELGVTLSVPGLLAGIYGNVKWMEELRERGELATAPTARAMGRKGGSRSTPEKRAASRKNGKLGGRPRKKLVAQ